MNVNFRVCQGLAAALKSSLNATHTVSNHSSHTELLLLLLYSCGFLFVLFLLYNRPHLQEPLFWRKTMTCYYWIYCIHTHMRSVNILSRKETVLLCRKLCGGMCGTRRERVLLSTSLHLKNVPWCPFSRAVTQKTGSSPDNNENQPARQLRVQPR